MTLKDTRLANFKLALSQLLLNTLLHLSKLLLKLSFSGGLYHAQVVVERSDGGGGGGGRRGGVVMACVLPADGVATLHSYTASHHLECTPLLIRKPTISLPILE